MDLAREFRRFKRWTKVWGIKHTCPFCHRPLSRFIPAGLDVPVLYDKQVVGGGLRESARCYICGSMDRERLVFLYLKHHSNMFKQHNKVLHIAPEPVLMNCFRQCKNLFYLTADLKSPRADVKLDLTALPFQDDTFDFVIVNHVFEHIPDDNLAMTEVLRVLKKHTGKAILQVPISLNLERTFEDSKVTTDEGRLEVFGQEDHVRIYGQDYKQKLESAGFSVDVFDWNIDDKHFSNNNKYGLIKEEKLFVGSKINSMKLG
ncbi:methyltransferase domain-containing protein [Paraglaciecola aquimarina]|uniref:Methyltransferase domain-containing protein n=1 Tax=Paraglaciecola algarum TaxID=3050085 RepID=A0ABS9D6S0_9ALTE|nr:class I SAM-dependent methyltransferase [Paraglaciecola sp. G1-23]MCF2948122.1 methyltransferase domain-containing protein [Paraglaciecola sp. G1-23]